MASVRFRQRILFPSWKYPGEFHFHHKDQIPLPVRHFCLRRPPHRTVCPFCSVLILADRYEWFPCDGKKCTFQGTVLMRCPMKKPTMQDPTSRLPGSCPDQSIVQACPLLHEYLVCTCYEDNSPRERSTISLWIEDSKVKVCLNDKNCKRSLYRAGDTVLEAIESLEEALADEATCDWRPWRKQK